MTPKMNLALATKLREAWAPFMNAMLSGLKTCPSIRAQTVYRGRWGLTPAAAADPGSLGWESSEIPGSACALTLEIAGSPHSGHARKMRQPRRS